MFRKWLHGLLVGLLIGAVFVAVPGAQTYIWSSINGIPVAPGLRVTGQAMFASGSEAAPGVAVGASNIGIYSTASTISLTVNGVQVVQFGTSNSYLAPTNLYLSSKFYLGDTDAVIGKEASAVIQLGSDVNGAAVPYTLKAHDGITGTDIAGANMILAGGRGTGAGAPGQVIFQTSSALGSGTTAQTLATRAIIDANGYLTVGTTAGTGANRIYAGSYYVGTTAGADCTSAAAVTTVKGIVTVCSAPTPDPLTQDEINAVRGLIAQMRGGQ